MKIYYSLLSVLKVFFAKIIYIYIVYVHIDNTDFVYLFMQYKQKHCKLKIITKIYINIGLAFKQFIFNKKSLKFSIQCWLKRFYKYAPLQIFRKNHFNNETRVLWAKFALITYISLYVPCMVRMMFYVSCTLILYSKLVMFYVQFLCSETVVRRCCVKKVFLKNF